MSHLLQEATQFFKSERTYGKLFTAFRKKYESLGRIGGTIPTHLFTDEELEEISKFFGQPMERIRAKQSIALVDFEKQLLRTKFNTITLKELLDDYFGETIISKKEQQLQLETNRRQFFLQLMEKYPTIKDWLQFCLENNSASRWVMQMAQTDEKKFAVHIKMLHEAVTALPRTIERLPLFSQRVTGDPHAFDLHTDLGRLFIHMLSIKQDEEVIPATTEEVNFLLQQNGIYRDDLLNFVTCANLLAATDRGEHAVWEAAVKTRTVQIVPIRELVKLTSVRPSFGKTVWMVENSGVFATLLDENPTVPIICTNGQYTLATWMLIDKLVESGAVIHYAGDFDPEGIGIADRLLERYGGSVQLWHMDVASYRKSRPSKPLTAERLEKLKRIHHPSLKAVAEEMRIIKKAGYQEALMEEMLIDIAQEQEPRERR